MTREQFVEIVNSVMDEEWERTAKELCEDNKGKSVQDFDAIFEMIVKSYTVSAEIAARTTAKIIEKLGLIQFEDRP